MNNTNQESLRWPKSTRAMSIGLMVPIGEGSAFGDPEPHFADMLAMTVAADDAGIEAAWFADHMTVPPRPDRDTDRATWEAFTMIGGLAGATGGRAIQLGTLVACTSFRSPGVLAKMTESLDDISDGRFILGLGAGWHKPEYDAFGFAWDHRASRFEEAIEIVHQMLRDGEATLEGRYSTANGAVNRPRGPRASTGGAPILVGTSGERMLRIMARYADAWNTCWYHETEKVEPLVAAMEAACRDVGRDPQTMVKTIGTNISIEGATGRRGDSLAGSDDEIAARLVAFRDMGFQHMIVGLDPCTPESIARFGEIIQTYDSL